MQYEVHPTDQTRDIDPKLNGSFKMSTPITKNYAKKEPDFSRTCGFRGCFRESLNFCFRPSKVTINDLDFRQNAPKVEKPQKRPFLSPVS